MSQTSWRTNLMKRVASGTPLTVAWLRRFINSCTNLFVQSFNPKANGVEVELLVVLLLFFGFVEIINWSNFTVCFLRVTEKIVVSSYPGLVLFLISCNV